MSFNQSRSDKSDSQYRKSGRSASFNQQRTSSGSSGRGGGGGQPAPSPSIASNRSFKKSNNNNAHGGQSRVVNSSEPGNRSAQNGGILPPQLHGASDVPVTSNAAKQTESAAGQRSSRAVPKAPSSQPTSMRSDMTAPTTPAKAPGDASKAFPFQFGSISPGFMNGMQIPARTSSAPPNLDEQKRDQARHDTLRSAPPMPVPSIPKQQAPRKEAAAVDQSNAGEPHPLPKAKKDTQISPGPPSSQTQKPIVHPMTGMSMQMPFHQPQVQFGGPNSQIQSQGMAATSLQMPMAMPLPMGNAPQVQQQVFVPGLQPHPMQAQGIMHQGQGLGFTTQMGPQLTPQIGNLGIAMSPQYPQQQGGKYGGQRKTTVKITHPETHEELRLDKRMDTYSDGGTSGTRSHPNVPQSQPIPSFPPSHPINYYPNSYNGSLFFPPPSSHPITSSQIAPNAQPPRFSYPGGQGPQNVSFMNPAGLNPVTLNKMGIPVHSNPEQPNLEHTREVHNTISTPAAQVVVKPSAGSIGGKVVESLPSSSSTAVEKSEFLVPSRPSGESGSSHPRRDSEVSSEISLQQPKSGGQSLSPKLLPVATKQPATAETLVSGPGSPASVSVETMVSNTEGRRREALSRSNSIKDHQRKPGKKPNNQSQHQVGGQSTSTSSFTSRGLEHGLSADTGGCESSEATTLPPSVSSEGVLKSVAESLSGAGATSPNAFESKVGIGEGFTSVYPKFFGADKQLKCDYVGTEEPGNLRSREEPKEDAKICEPEPISSELIEQTEQEAVLKASTSSDEFTSSGTAQMGLNETVSSHKDIGKATDNFDTSALDSSDAKTLSSDVALPTSDQQSAPAASSDICEAALKNEGDGVESMGGVVSLQVSGSKDKPTVELHRTKSTAARGKKKRKEILQKADAAGTTSDLYMAYKGPEEKKEAITSSEGTSNSDNSKQAAVDALREDNIASDKGEQSKTEPDDWEDAADISTPKLETSDDGEQVHGSLGSHDNDGNMAKKYSRDFLLKFAEQCTELPDGFEVTSDISDVLISANVNVSAPGRNVDNRPSSGSRPDRRGSGIVDDDRWNKVPGSFGPGRMDVNYGGNVGFRPNQGGNYGVLRNPRGQAPVQYAGGILSGPMQSLGSQGGMQRNSPDADRWQRAANFQQKGLIPSPQTPLQMMHKAERKYEVGKITDEEEAKQRQLKAILNKLTPQNFEKLFEQVKAVNIDNAQTLTGVISQIFDKALMEPTFCEMYANFCFHLAGELPDFSEDNEKITFKRLLLNKCQEEFERGEREQEEADKADEEGEAKQSDEAREEKRVKARRRMLGNIRLIGELYKKKMLTERIMHECIKKLLGQYQNPDEEDVEALCKLMSTIGEMIDHPKAKEHMDAYFDMMFKLSNNMKLSSRVRFMLKDAIDLRKNKWQQRRKVEGPKKIEEVHRDAAQERQAQTSRLARGPGMNPSSRRGAPTDFGPRGGSAMLSSPGNQMGFRGLPTQVRGFGGQDVRFDDRQSYDARALSVPLPQRPMGDDSITLGPQGGLARGMSIRGPPSMSSGSISETSPSPGDSRRMATGLNGYSPAPERTSFTSREDLIPRYAPDRFTGPAAYDQSGPQERNMNYGNRDPRTTERTSDRSVPTSPPTRQVQASAQNVSSEKVWPEDRLRDMSMAAIKEFYSARDEQEVALCIKDLNSPSFHPTMISLWVTDSFERKDKERDLLADLLVNLSKSGDSILSQAELVQGFESALTSLEDAVNDAPKAPEFLGRIFAKVVIENVVPLGKIGKLIHEGGEVPGSLLEFGLAADVLGSTLDLISSEKGEGVLNELCKSSNLRLETFQPPDPNRSRKLDKFIRG